MIKRRIKLGREEAYNEIPTSFTSEIISAYALVSETKRFLDRYFKGSFVSSGDIYIGRNVYISRTGFAYILKLIFAEVYARELIRISCELKVSTLSFDFEFSVELMSDECIERLSKAARLSGFGFDITERGVRLSTNAFIAQSLDLCAGRALIIYNALEDAFFENIYLQDNDEI